jgi:HD-GYP domain-containing protein (c-di-GMP phosphodiesterase class II)
MHILAVHADNVAHIVAFLASLDAVWRSHRHSLVIAAFFMDAGMMRCALDVLGSSQPLTPEQRTRVERHPHESAALAERVQGLDESLVEAVRMHHERLDGTGYPSGCRGDDIRVPARLLAAADVYIACRSYRPHRPALSPKDALTTALSQAEAGQLDALRVRGLLNLSLYPVGTIVELSTAEIAEVIAPQNAQLDPTLAGQPIVRLLVDRRGQPVALPLYRNLAIRPDCRITRVISVEEAAARRAAI